MTAIPFFERLGLGRGEKALINLMYPSVKDSLIFNAMVLKVGEISLEHPTQHHGLRWWSAMLKRHRCDEAESTLDREKRPG